MSRSSHAPRPETSPARSPIGASQPQALGIAMVGHAFMGRAHGNAFRQANRFFELPYQLQPRVVVGRHLERAEAARDKFGFQEASDDLAAVLERPDVHLVDVATPNDTHHAIALAALRAGKHVLCEKPLALSLQQAREMAAAAKRTKARAGIWHNYRRAPAAALARRLIQRGDVGEIRHVRAVYLQDWLNDPAAPGSWRTDVKTAGSGAHGDLNAHLVDLTLFLTGLRFKEVCAAEQTFTRVRKTPGGKRVPVTVDDAFAFLARFENGALGTFEATRCAAGRKNCNRIELNGSLGSLEWDFERMNELRFFSTRDVRDAQGFRTILALDPLHPYAGHWWPDGHLLGYEHGFVHTVVDFVTAVASGAPFAPDFDDGVRVMAVLEAALKSAATGRWVGVPRSSEKR
jgi:predicted dehydrogenase